MKAIVRLLAGLSVTAALLFAAPAFAIDSGDIVVASTKGEVHIVSNGTEKNLRAGAVLELPASVRTGHDGSVVLKQGATSVDVGPDTLLEFPALEKHGAPVDRIVQPRGNAFYDVGKRDGRKLRVETPYLVGVIKGTQFNVAAAEDSTTISLFEGRLEVRATDEGAPVVDLLAGEIASRKRGAKLISVIKMEPGKAPPTQRPTSTGSNGSNDGSAGSPGSSRPAGGDTQVSGPPVRTDLRGGNEVAVSADVRANGNDAGLNADVRAGGVQVNAAANVGVDAGVNTTVNLGSNGVDATVGVNVGAGPVAVDAGVNAGVDVGNGVRVDAGLNAGVDAGVASADLGAAANVSLGNGAVAVDLGANTNVDVGGAAAVDAGANASVDLGNNSVRVDVDVATDVAAGPVTTDVGVGTGVAVDLGSADVAANVDVGAAAGVGDVAVVDAGAGAAIDLGTSPDVSANVDVGANVAGVNAGVTTGADLSAGNVNLGVSLGGIDLGVNLDLGLDDGNNGHGNDAGHNDTSSPGNSPPPPAAPPGNTDLGGLLDSLLRRPGRR